MSAQEKKKKKPRKDRYVNLDAKRERGDFSDLIDPLDYIILGSLPDEGTMFGGVYPEGKNAGSIVKEKFDGLLTANQVSTRISTLSRLGLALQVKSLSGAGQKSWQKTKRGKEVVEEWQQTHEPK